LVLVLVPKVEDDGGSHPRMMAWVGSIVHPDKPAVNGVVRGFNHPCGTYVALDAAPNGSCAQVRVILVWHSDIKGWLPARAVDQAMGDQMFTSICNLRTYLTNQSGAGKGGGR